MNVFSAVLDNIVRSLSEKKRDFRLILLNMPVEAQTAAEKLGWKVYRSILLKEQSCVFMNLITSEYIAN